MKFRFTIARRLLLSFGLITIAILLNSFFINNTLQQSIKKNNEISMVYLPSAEMLSNLSDMMVSSKMLIKNWVYIDKKQDTPDKIKLQELHQSTFHETHKALSKLTINWTPEEQKCYNEIYLSVKDTLFPMHQDIMNRLSTIEDYENVYMMMFDIYPLVEEGGDVIVLSDRNIDRLNKLTKQLQAKVLSERTNMEASFNRLENFIYIAGIILITLAVLMALYLGNKIIRPVKYFREHLISMAKGVLPKQKVKETQDEIGDMAAALNELIRGLKETTEFALEIGKGNFEFQFVPLSDEDDLGNGLLTMRTNLKHASEEEERRQKEDAQRNWSSHGIAKFSEILRQNNDNVEKLTYDVMSNLVKYCEANQGGLFLINDDDQRRKYVELVASYAYNRKKFLDKQIEMGVGLVGRSIQEGETIYMTEIPDNYITITSGLGDDNPKSLLIVPLKVNDTVYGVIEMASFKEFEKYQIEFVEKIGENIAATLSSVKINIRTAQLLETTRQQAEEMKAQEEEMRQNMEELQATQEESARRESELEKKVAEYERLRKQQESFVKKLGGSFSGEMVSALDEDEDEEVKISKDDDIDVDED
ncbi:MAG: hypothetical protein A2W99_01720 [Bacteroidetes bacterium GWF2_33_16]|nr:MAG: hypothetical protein A2X00_16435 [Bacteroidetes bacterium GWE2_32_14]OFY06988.1 MAG: hypothetical protein A2W99_01720 [Bacteroidetes bacterium GWF2_33_16]